MKVLWSINNIPPKIAETLGLEKGHAISWVEAMSEQIALRNSESVLLAIMAPSNCRGIIKKTLGNITYYAYPYDNCLNYLQSIVDDFKPDLIHLYGTEQKQNAILVSELKLNCPTIVSLQGILSEYIKHYSAGLSNKEIFANTSIRGFVFGNEISKGKKNYQKGIITERTILNTVKYVEGRSLWDRSAALKINPSLNYYYCPRMIRKEFYRYKWDISCCEKHSILVHQGNYPIKGLHFVLDALSIVRARYPDVKLYICGTSFTKCSKVKRKLFGGTYANIIRKKVEPFISSENVVFLGNLSSEEMAEKLSNVYTCINSSSIENVPNSVAEAMLVGTPIIASCVGGTAEMLNYGECGYLYSYDDSTMLAGLICHLFENSEEAIRLSSREYAIAHNRHDQAKLSSRLIDIYKNVLELEKDEAVSNV